MPASPWFSDLHDNDENWVVVPGSELNLGNSFPESEPWMEDCVRTGSRRKGDYLIQEELGGPWPTSAEACAIDHALHGDQDSIIWAGFCPIIVGGAADLEAVGNSSVAYQFSDHTGPPFLSDSAHMVVNTIAYGVWLKPVEENLQERGVLPFPDPPDYGYPADSDVEWEAPEVTIWKVAIADAGGDAFAPDPDSRYAVNYNRQPEFSTGAWGPWQKGVLPGLPLGGVDSATFASEAVGHGSKTWYELDVPSTITEDYLNDPYDYGVAAGPAEAFDERDLTATRTASTAVIVKVYVRSPRFRFVHPDIVNVIPPRRIFQRSDGLTHGARRTLGGGNTIQSGNRAIGGIL